MLQISRPSAAISAVLLSTAPLLLASSVASAVEDERSKAYIEYGERNAEKLVPASPATKAQIEHLERQQQPGAAGRKLPVSEPANPAGGGDATAWQLALSAALGAALTGGVVVASRQVSQHRHAVAH